MNHRTLLLTALLLIGLSTIAAKSPKIVVAGSGMDKIVVLDKQSGQIDWSYPLPKGGECNSVAVDKKGDLVFAYSKGARLVTTTKKIRWDYIVPSGEELHTAITLPDGGYLLGICGNPSRIVELDKKGTLRKQITFDTGIKNPHGQFRQIKKSKTGTYLVPLMGKPQLLELSAEGELLRTYPLPAPSFSVLELKSGNLLLSCGDAHMFAEMDRTSGNIVRKIDNTTLQEKGVLHFLAQIVQLNNGNLLVSSWNGHFKKGENTQVPHIIELDADNRIVWRYDNHTDISKVSTLFYIENGTKWNSKQQ